MVMHARQQVFGGPDQTLCGLPAEGLDTVFGCWNDGVFGEVVTCGENGGPDVMRPTTGFDCSACIAVVAASGEPARESEVVHFPSNRVGLTWCGLSFASPGGSNLKGRDRNGLPYSTDMADVTCQGCAAGDPVYPEQETLAPSEVALAKILAAVEANWIARDGSEEAEVVVAIEDLLCVHGLRESDGLRDVPTAAGRALLERARRAGVL